MSSKDLRNKEFHTEIVKRSATQYMVMTSFQRTHPEDWGSSNEKDNFYKMTTFEQWNYSDDQRGILPTIKKDITRYKNASRSSFDYVFAHHAKSRLL